MAGSLGHTKGDAEEEVLPCFVGSGRIAGSSALEHTSSSLRLHSSQECWMDLQVAAPDH